MLRSQFFMPRFISIIFIGIVLKLSYFFKKMQNFRALGAPPPDPRAFGGQGQSPQTARIAPHIANFWLRAWMSANQLKFISLNPKFLEFSTDLFRIIDVTTAAYNDRIFNS